MQSLLSGRTAAEIRTDPFPHLVAADCLAPDDYAALCAHFPAVSRITWSGSGPSMRSNRRFAMPATALLAGADIAPCWKAFAARHSGPEFFSEVAAFFDGYWPDAMLRALGGTLAGHSMGPLDLSAPGAFKIHLDARIEINTPVLTTPSVVRGPHLDTPNRLYSCLFYLRHPDDDSFGGELLLYRWRASAERRVDCYALDEAEVEVAAVIPYRANQMVIFPQTIDSVHGVGLRHPTPHVRRYVFVTAELADPWLEA
ncbi:2OG-Fe(II) oxygenase [Sphingomonas suaedae]|uniref:2OG-Fe(II) oxygenase n=1 Tax=Sphingomonas suaedae TaxID=2599297 RepID=UPI001646CBF0|nr:2OG-Fe(II) oxygenase [Sphingomonas suaedae]